MITSSFIAVGQALPLAQFGNCLEQVQEISIIIKILIRFKILNISRLIK